jgi:hypothetical protein
MPANLYYGTGIPACIVVLDKQDAHARKGIFMIDASQGFMKDGPKNRLRAQDIHKIVDVFNKRLEVPKYARMVPVEEIEKNEFNLNLPRYIDSQTPEDLQDIEGHLKVLIEDKAWPRPLGHGAETPDWDEKARDLTGGGVVDCVVEIGGPGTIAKSLKALAVGGHVSLIGANLARSGIMLDPLLLTGRSTTVGAISVGSRVDFEAMNRTIALHSLRPVIDRTFKFAEAKEGHRHFEGPRRRGD